MNDKRNPFPRARTFWLVLAVLYAASCASVMIELFTLDYTFFLFPPSPYLALVPGGPYLYIMPVGLLLYGPSLYFELFPVEPSLFIGVVFWLWVIWGTIGAVKKDRAREREIQKAIPRVAHLHRRPNHPDDAPQ